MTISAPTALACTLVALASTIASPRTNAATLDSHAAGFCQPALPVFDTAVRKRPLGVANEGGVNVFVTCSLPGLTVSGPQTNALGVDLTIGNRGAAAQTVSCTGVNGVDFGGVLYAVKSRVVGANTFSYIFFRPQDFNQTSRFPQSFFSVSCSLPPGTSISDGHAVF